MEHVIYSPQHPTPRRLFLDLVRHAVWTFAGLAHGLLSQAALQSAYVILSIYGIVQWSRCCQRNERGATWLLR